VLKNCRPDIHPLWSGRTKPYMEITCSGRATVWTRLLNRKDFQQNFWKILSHSCPSGRRPYDHCIGTCECYYLVSSFVFWIVEFLGLAAPEWIFSWLSFHFVNKKLFVFYFQLCLIFVDTCCTHFIFRSQFQFSHCIHSKNKSQWISSFKPIKQCIHRLKHIKCPISTTNHIHCKR